MKPLIIYQRRPFSFDDGVEALAAYYLQSSAWTEEEHESLCAAIHKAVEDWFDDALKESK